MWTYLTQGMDEQQVEQYRIRLYVPPVGVAPTSGPWSAEAEAAATRAFAAQLEGRPAHSDG